MSPNPVPSLNMPWPQFFDPRTSGSLVGSRGNSLGAQFIDTTGQLRTYRAAKLALALAATPTVVASLIGAASKIVRVRKFSVSGAAATAVQVIPVSLNKCSAAPTSGTGAAAAAVPLDSGSIAAGAVFTTYTVNPTTGTLIGTIGVRPVAFQPPTNVGAADCWDEDFTNRNDQGIVLRGAAETIVWHLNAVALNNATTLNIDIEWTEEATS